jgi:hypothetical protein
MKKILGLVIVISISSCTNSTNEIKDSSVVIVENKSKEKKDKSIDEEDIKIKSIPSFSGKWNWKESSGYGNWGFSININQKNDSIYGIFDAYAQGGNKMDQGREIIQKYNIIGIVKKNVAYLKFASAWSDEGELGGATLEKKSDSILEWKITKRPMTLYGDFWIVENCILKQK